MKKIKKNPNNYCDTENAMGYVLIEAQRLVGNEKQFLPTCWGKLYTRFCDFIDQLIKQQHNGIVHW